jgi:hypothetical protein
MKSSSRKVLVTSVLGVVSAVVLIGVSTQAVPNTSEFASITKYPELSYKASSPRGDAAGVVIPASCESNYDHALGAAYYDPSGARTNVPNAGEVYANRAIRLAGYGCVWTTNNEFFSREYGSVWGTRAVNAGMPRWSSGSYDGH